MITLLLASCTSPLLDSGQQILLDTQAESSCQTTIEFPDLVDMGIGPAMGFPLKKSITVFNHSTCATILLGDPNGWISGEGFYLLDFPQVIIEPNGSIDLELAFQPSQEGSFDGTLQLLFDTTVPATVTLTAKVTPPRTLVFVGDGLHRVSTIDYGENIVETLETQQPNTESVQRGICWGKNRFLAVGGVNERRFWTSFDGFEWQSGSAEGTGLKDCAYGNDRFVSFDAEVPLYSIAGMQWEEGAGTPWMTTPLRAITYDGQVFVAVGNQGRIAVTQTGEQWDTDTSIGNFNLHSIAAGQGVLVAVGSYGAVVRSVDHGQTWTEQRVGDATFQRVLHTGSEFIISDGSSLYVSTDGEVWVQNNSEGIKPIVSFGTLLFGLKERTLYRSFNQGKHWSPINTFQYPTPLFDAVSEGNQ